MSPQDKNELINALIGMIFGIAVGVLITYAILQGMIR